MKITSKKFSSIFVLQIFLTAVFLLIVISLGFKAFFLINESKFRLSSYTVLVISKKAYVLRIDKKLSTLSILVLNDKKGILTNSMLANSIFLHIPLDGEIISEDGEINDVKTQLLSAKTVFSVFFSNPSFHLLQMNSYDFIKLYFWAKQVPKRNIQEKTIQSISSYKDNNFELNTILSDLFGDQDIINEKTSVEVVNATGINGLGGKVSQMLENTGFDVVSVSSTDTNQSSAIFLTKTSNSSKSLLKIQNLFPFEAKGSEQGIADIRILLGSDVPSALKNLEEN